jgi:hypothetical protein
MEVMRGNEIEVIGSNRSNARHKCSNEALMMQ